MMRVLVLLSGGLDSAFMLHHLSSDCGCEAVSFDYGQPHLVEIDRAKRLAAEWGVPHRVVQLPPMPKVDDVIFAGRNLALVSVAVSIAAAEGFGAVAIGCNRSDWNRFPDCRPQFWGAIRTAALEAYGV
jgi:7-cyano-7-deazaguanine synthase